MGIDKEWFRVEWNEAYEHANSEIQMLLEAPAKHSITL